MARYRMRLRRPAFRGIAVPFVPREHVAFRLVLVGLLAGVLVGPLWWFTTQTVGGQWVGDLVLYGQSSADPAAIKVAGETLGFVSIASAIAATAGLVLVAVPRGGVTLALAVLVSVGGANTTAQVLKRVLDRPDLLGSLAYATGNSFPSGHVALVASLAFAVVLILPRGVRTLMALLASFVVAAVAVSTMSLAWHRLADVVGGMLIALAWASLSTAILVWRQGWMPRRTWARGRAGLAIGSAAVLGTIAVVGGVLMLVVGLLASDVLKLTIEAAASEPAAFLAALIAAVGASLIGNAAYVWAMNGVAVEAA